MTLCFLFKVWLQTKAPKPFVQKMICCCKQCDNIELFCVHQFTTVRLYINKYNLAYDIPVNNDRYGTESVGFSHSISSTSKEQRQSQNKLKQPGHRGRACWSGISCFMKKKKKKHLVCNLLVLYDPNKNSFYKQSVLQHDAHRLAHHALAFDWLQLLLGNNPWSWVACLFWSILPAGKLDWLVPAFIIGFFSLDYICSFYEIQSVAFQNPCFIVSLPNVIIMDPIGRLSYIPLHIYKHEIHPAIHLGETPHLLLS